MIKSLQYSFGALSLAFAGIASLCGYGVKPPVLSSATDYPQNQYYSFLSPSVQANVNNFTASQNTWNSLWITSDTLNNAINFPIRSISDTTYYFRAIEGFEYSLNSGSQTFTYESLRFRYVSGTYQQIVDFALSYAQYYPIYWTDLLDDIDGNDHALCVSMPNLVWNSDVSRVYYESPEDDPPFNSLRCLVVQSSLYDGWYTTLNMILSQVDTFMGHLTYADLLSIQSASNVRQQGFNDGYSKGYNDGKSQGYDEGFIQGQNAVSNAGVAVNTMFGAIVGIPISVLNGLMPLAVWDVPIVSIFITLMVVGLVIWLIKRFI